MPSSIQNRDTQDCKALRDYVMTEKDTAEVVFVRLQHKIGASG